jgi:hypothetical protein
VSIKITELIFLMILRWIYLKSRELVLVTLHRINLLN